MRRRATAAKVRVIPLEPVEKLGKDMLYDDTMSNPDGYACATCHAPATGLSTGLSSIVNERGGPQPGVVPGRFGPRKPMSYGYAAFSPEGPYFDTNVQVWVGGQKVAEKAPDLADKVKSGSMPLNRAYNQTKKREEAEKHNQPDNEQKSPSKCYP